MRPAYATGRTQDRRKIFELIKSLRILLRSMFIVPGTMVEELPIVCGLNHQYVAAARGCQG